MRQILQNSKNRPKYAKILRSIYDFFLQVVFFFSIYAKKTLLEEKKSLLAAVTNISYA